MWWLVIEPVLLSSLQYLQRVLLQKENPLSFCVVPCALGWVCLVPVGVGIGVSTVLVGAVRNLSMVSCVPGLGIVGARSVSVGAVGSVSGVCELGSYCESPGNLGMCALTKMSLRFLGRLYPVINFLL